MFILCVLAYSQNSRESDVDLWWLKPGWTIFTFLLLLLLLLLPSVNSGPGCGCYAFIDLKNSSEQRGALDQSEVWRTPRVNLINCIFPQN